MGACIGGENWGVLSESCPYTKTKAPLRKVGHEPTGKAQLSRVTPLSFSCDHAGAYEDRHLAHYPMSRRTPTASQPRRFLHQVGLGVLWVLPQFLSHADRDSLRRAELCCDLVDDAILDLFIKQWRFLVATAGAAGVFLGGMVLITRLPDLRQPRNHTTQVRCSFQIVDELPVTLLKL